MDGLFGGRVDEGLGPEIDVESLERSQHERDGRSAGERPVLRVDDRQARVDLDVSEAANEARTLRSRRRVIMRSALHLRHQPCSRD